MARYLKDFPLLIGKSLGEYAKRFTDPLIREGIANVNYDETLPLMSLVMTLGPMSKKAAGFPLGGSKEFSQAIEKRYRDLGGTVTYGARVEKILEEGGRATGVRLAGGAEVKADYVVSAMDMKATLFSLLDGTRLDPLHKELFDTVRVMDPCVQVSFGVDRDFSLEPDGNELFQLDTPVEITGKRLEWFNYKHFSFDPSMAPAGKAVVSSFFPADWEYWRKLADDRAAYKAEKERIAGFCAEQMEKRFPGFSTRIEMTDVATPLTWVRYTGNWKGTFMTWQLSPEFQQKHRFIPKTVPGLEGMYMASMWTTPPGGVSGAARPGRDVLQLICRKDGQALQGDNRLMVGGFEG